MSLMAIYENLHYSEVGVNNKSWCKTRITAISSIFSCFPVLYGYTGKYLELFEQSPINRTFCSITKKPRNRKVNLGLYIIVPHFPV